ncbi:expressed unknown protein [Seminavis robusta]|uniref:Uncharacterized protein n=1 Tax=Seminavis robusta TaxID=568900 RepID=A0A9N8E0B7_9STRA|nr:expressed unknown protein [Seminavis robusta]|eukprot:Sro384_g131530.1 n/a (657) ;mRNA; r:57239-59209
MNDNNLPKLLEETTLEDDTLPSFLTNLKPTCTAVEVTLGGTVRPISHITEFPMELQVNILTYLRAYELTAIPQTCRFYHNPSLIHAIVTHAAEGGVYPPELSKGFEDQPVMSDAATASSNNNSNGKNKKAAKKKAVPVSPTATTMKQFTLEHLRNMELLVVVRVLSRPEPFSEDDSAVGGYFVSKSWCKTALKWLEWQQERQQQQQQQEQQQQLIAVGNTKKSKKLSKKQQRLRSRKYSDASPPWPNVNSDIVCCHQQLQRCSNRKSARARRKILDKQAWKCLKKLYPESIPLEAKEGECLQCILEAETEKKTHAQEEEKRKEERKAPLSQPVLRRFYTRTRGLPVHCLRKPEEEGGRKERKVVVEEEDRKMPATPTKSMLDSSSSDNNKKPSAVGGCPLVPGLYYAVPRAWCHAWRKYMKTGEGGPLLPPDGSALLCDAHRLALLPPHLDAYLYGESPQLWVSKKQQLEDEQQQQQLLMDESSSPRRSLVVGMSPLVATADDLPAAELGLSPAELALQQRAMMTLERQRDQQREAAAMMEQEHGRRASLGEQLDRENYCCVEILAHDELEALEKLWPRQSVFRMSFEVLRNGDVSFSTQPCRECDASGHANFCKIAKTSKAQLRAAHQVKVRGYNNKTCNNSVNGGAKPGVQLEY